MYQNKPGFVVYHFTSSGFVFSRVFKDVAAGVEETKQQLDDGVFEHTEVQRIHGIEPIGIQRVTYTSHWLEAEELQKVFFAGYYADGTLLNEVRYPDLCGAFRITHRPTGKYVIGATGSLLDRFRVIVAKLRSGTYNNEEFQAAWNSNPDTKTLGLSYTITTDREQAKVVAQSMIDSAPNDPLHVGLINRVPKKHIGVYTIRFGRGLIYIGSTGDYNHRRSVHTYQMSNNTHSNPVIAAMSAAGALGDVTWEFIPCESRETAYDLEQQYLTLHKNDQRCVNRSTDARSSVSGGAMTEEVVARRNESIRRTHQRPENRAKRSVMSLGMWSDPERREARNGAGNPFAKSIEVNGVRYGSVKDAVKAVGIGEKTLRKRANDDTCLEVSW